MNENIIEIQQHHEKSMDIPFREFMNLTEREFNIRAKQYPQSYKNCSAFELENLTVRLLKEISPATPFKVEDINLVSGSRFPDIVAGHHFGVEVKSTEKNHWTSTGSSIVESSRISGIEHIYMLFGKLGGKYAEFRCRPYEEVLSEIAVTHSPRYLIDMNLQKGESIFDKMGTTYDRLRTSSDNIEQVRSYYRQKAKREGKHEMPWWLNESQPAKMNLRLWTTHIPEYNEENKHITAKMFILFPEIIKSQYGDIAMWLVSRYSIVAYNLRDIFSAGGQLTHINGKKLQFTVPHIIYEILTNASLIKFYLRNPSNIHDELVEFRPDLVHSSHMYQLWLHSINADINSLPVICKHGEIPFIEWFETEAVPSIVSR